MSIIDKWERSGQGDSGILHKTSDDEQYEEEVSEHNSETGNIQTNEGPRFEWGGPPVELVLSIVGNHFLDLNDAKFVKKVQFVTKPLSRTLDEFRE